MRAEIPGFAYAFGFDPITGRVTLQSEAPESAFAKITDQFPNKIDFRPGTFSLASMANDTQPYKGGAYIAPSDGSGNLCTSGFTMILPNGNKRMVTAGHCYANGEATTMGTAVRSSAIYPYYDIEQIYGATYAGKIYYSSSSSLKVMSSGNPTIGGTYCTSGRTTGVYCAWKLRSLNVTICYTQNYPDGACAHSLAGFDDPALGKHVQPGDSGGPLWLFWNNDMGIGIRGVVSGWFWDIWSGRYVSYATQYNRIATEFGGNAYIP